MKEQILQPFQEKISALDKNHPAYETKKEHLQDKTDKLLDVIISFKKNKRKRKFKDIDQKTTECLNTRKTKMVVEFNKRESPTKSFTINNTPT